MFQEEDDMKTCPHCGFQGDPTVTKCPRCGIIFKKWEAIEAREKAGKNATERVEEEKKDKKEKPLAGKWEFYVKGHGKVSLQSLKQLAHKKRIEPKTSVYVGNLEKWVVADSIQGLFTFNPLSKIFGISTIVGGVVGLLYALNMQTYVYSKSLGAVHNIGLLAKQRNWIIVSAMVIIIGIAATAFSFIKKNKNEMKECPDCAESVRIKATKCRFCGHVFED